jgi:hypothetical protein
MSMDAKTLAYAQQRLVSLQGASDEALGQVFELLHELDAVEILRLHTPPSRRWQLDRLETALRLADGLRDVIEDAVAFRDYVEEELEKKEGGH